MHLKTRVEEKIPIEWDNHLIFCQFGHEGWQTFFSVIHIIFKALKKVSREFGENLQKYVKFLIEIRR